MTFIFIIGDLQISPAICDEDDGMFGAYVLMVWDEGKAAKMALDKIREQEDIYNKLRGSGILEELEINATEYCKRYGCD